MSDGSFRMVIDAMWKIGGPRGSVVTGVVEGGPIRVGDRVEKLDGVGAGRVCGQVVFETTVRAIEVERQLVGSAAPGAFAGLLLDDPDGDIGYPSGVIRKCAGP